MRTKPFALAGSAMLFILASCSSDDAPTATPTANNANAVFDHYTVELNAVQANPSQTYRTFTTANLLDQKFFSETMEQFIDGVSQVQFTRQHYFYENNLLIKRVYDDDVRDFFYDIAGKLIAVNWRYGDFPNHYYRFVYTGNIVFFERLSLPYDDPGTQIMNRSIVEFDAYDNIIKAGNDVDLDGEFNGYLTFDYDTANNLIKVHKQDGTTVDLAYSQIKDNFAQIAINTYGKKNLMVYQAESFANLMLRNLRQSPNLRETDTQEAVIEAPVLPYYFKKTETLASDNNETTIVTTFYFGH